MTQFLFVAFCILQTIILVISENLLISEFGVNKEYDGTFCAKGTIDMGTRNSPVSCGILCKAMTACTGFFFNTASKNCSIVEIVSLPENECKPQAGSVYYMLLEKGWIDCYRYTSNDISNVRVYGSRSWCNSYSYHTSIWDINLSQFGCETCYCCKSKGCYIGSAQTYNGTWSKTISGRRCQNWNSQSPHQHSDHLGVFPDGETAFDARYYCRDPNGKGYPWCYTLDGDIRWESCEIPVCP